MLNISRNRINGKINIKDYKSFGMVKEYKAGKTFARLLSTIFIIVLLIMFLPWTQNIQSNGYITTLQPEQRPQTINSIIAGRIEKWFVREGDFVNKGDTIMFISEIKDDYFDPQLLSRTEQQIKAKEMSVMSYMEKVKSLDSQINALIKTGNLKVQQARNYIRQAELKIESDSLSMMAAQTDFDIASRQYERTQELYDDGLKSLTELEIKKGKAQETQSKLIGAENKLLGSKNELLNALAELTSVDQQYKDKLSKAESEKYEAMSNMYTAEGEVTKMQNQFMNYSVRTGMYYITSPQNGYITKAIRSGIGETLKEGEQLVSIMPSDYDLAVEMYVKPVDLPLVEIGQPVRFIFDGWPSIIFSGWPNVSYGSFGGKVVAVDRFISDNDKYRILVSPDENDVPWPQELRVGSGARGMALLKDVPIWYELWRQLNGFPPDYYKLHENSNNKKAAK